MGSSIIHQIRLTRSIILLTNRFLQPYIHSAAWIHGDDPLAWGVGVYSEKR